MAAPPDQETRPSARQRLAGLRHRALAAVVLVPAMLVLAWRGDEYFVLLVMLLLFLGMIELLRMQRAKGVEPDAFVAGGAALLLPWAMYGRDGALAEPALALLFGAATLRALWRGKTQNAMPSLAATLFAVLYVGWLGAHLVRLRELPGWLGRDPVEGFRFVFLALLFTWVSDTAAYFFGTLFGRHRLVPRVSPGKSWEGAIAALACTAAAGSIAAATFLRAFLAPWAGALLGFLASAVGQVGDLLASLLKRDAAVKDTSHLIPGHGGVLDRFDSLLLVAPLLYWLLRSLVF
ncbi:MAG TPA: phosphatidate cytidylyltransferase [Candidatus Krumholzibacteria bacterium]|nr:phosphatidate cytidylyltransferase [Candidatus Krumholzibacteria bacterium]